MKTAMQLFYAEIEKFENDFKTDFISITDVKRMIGNCYIEKEKQQIVNARIDGVQKSLSIPKTFAFKKSEEYYDSNFGDKVEGAGI